MVQVSRHTELTAPALIRSLARLTDASGPEPRQAFSDRLSQWLGWADAIALSSALNGAPAPASGGPKGAGEAQQAECARVRAALAKAVADDVAWAVAGPRGPGAAAAPAVAPSPAVPDFAPIRLRYLARQQAMDAAVGPLRERLRALLATRSPALSRLAAVDAVMAQVLGEQERRLLATVPALLERHFEVLCQGEQDPPGAWLSQFGQALRGVMLAELDIRFQPVEGLLDALRQR